LTLISSLIDAQTLEPTQPSAERQAFFERTTSLAFAMPLVTGRSDVVSLDCPFCLRKNHLVKWVADGEKGFAQPKFEYNCESCRQIFTKSNIGVRRFAEEVARMRAGQKVYLSETLLDPRSGVIDTKEATAFTARIFKVCQIWLEHDLCTDPKHYLVSERCIKSKYLDHDHTRTDT
jgi:hypothetical protein